MHTPPLRPSPGLHEVQEPDPSPVRQVSRRRVLPLSPPLSRDEAASASALSSKARPPPRCSGCAELAPSSRRAGAVAAPAGGDASRSRAPAAAARSSSRRPERAARGDAARGGAAAPAAQLAAGIASAAASTPEADATAAAAAAVVRPALRRSTRRGAAIELPAPPIVAGQQPEGWQRLAGRPRASKTRSEPPSIERKVSGSSSTLLVSTCCLARLLSFTLSALRRQPRALRAVSSLIKTAGGPARLVRKARHVKNTE